MEGLFLFESARERDPAVDAWLDDQPGELGHLARHWFEVARSCGDDVRELLHDQHPTACAGAAAFLYVDAFTAHVNVGFYKGADLFDPAGLLQGKGRFMRHVKLRPGEPVDEEALEELVREAYDDMTSRRSSGDGDPAGRRRPRRERR